MNLLGLSIGQPWVLWGLLICPLFVLATWRTKLFISRGLLTLATASRVLAAALVVLALADARVRWPTSRLAVAVVVDSSASVSAREAAATRAAFRRVAGAQRDAQWLEVDAPRGPLALGRTDLETQLSTALGVLPTDRVRRIVIATDGRETHGDVIAAADRARREGATVSVLAMGDNPAADLVAVNGLDVPRLIRAGRSVTVGVRLFAANERDVGLEVLRDGVRLAQSTVRAPAGPSIHDVTVEFPDEGVHTLEVRATPDRDFVAENNVWRSLVRVVTPPRVLLVHELAGGTPALATVYRDARLRVDAVQAVQVPEDAAGFEPYQLAVLDELLLTSLSEAQQRALRTWVEERGGGLVTITGTHGVGRDPEILREIEPIRPPRAIPEPRPLELILVIDRSGSMGGSPMENARQAGVAAIRALRIDARVGAVAFSGAADATLPPVPMDRANEATSFVTGLQAGGGTDIGAALQAAAGLVTADDRYLHHVILLSDGESDYNSGIAGARAVVARGATITTITLGDRNQLMNDIARIGRGRYHVTRSPSSLAPLFVREAQYHTPPPLRNVNFRPAVVTRMGFLDGIDWAAEPAIGGFTLSDARPGADTVLQQTENGPLLAHWFVGLGQVATWASATSGAWANGLRAGNGFRRLFSQMAWEMLRAQSEDGLEVHVDADRQRPDVRRVSVVTASVGMTPRPIAMISRAAGNGGSVPIALRLEPRGPGLWQAEVPLGSGFVVDARLPSSPEATVAAGADAPYASELSAFGSDGAMLAAIAAAGGGRVLRGMEDAFTASAPVRLLRDVRVPLLAAALIAYLLGVLALRLPSAGPARAASHGERGEPESWRASEAGERTERGRDRAA